MLVRGFDSHSEIMNYFHFLCFGYKTKELCHSIHHALVTECLNTRFLSPYCSLNVLRTDVIYRYIKLKKLLYLKSHLFNSGSSRAGSVDRSLQGSTATLNVDEDNINVVVR